MDDALQAYAYLWTTHKRDWVLLGDEESAQTKDYMPYNIKTWRFLDIPNEAVHQAVIAQMIAAGVRQVTDEDVFGKKD